MAVTLKERAEYLAAVREARRSLEEKVKRAKEVEEKVADAILQELQALGVTSMKVEGVGRLTATTRTHAEIRDYGALASHIYQNMRTAIENDWPLQSALEPLQKRATKKYFEELAEKGKEVEGAGVALVQKTTITLTQK